MTELANGHNVYRRLLFRELANLDVPKPNGVAVVLQHDVAGPGASESFRAIEFARGYGFVPGWAAAYDVGEEDVIQPMLEAFAFDSDTRGIPFTYWTRRSLREGLQIVEIARAMQIDSTVGMCGVIQDLHLD